MKAMKLTLAVFLGLASAWIVLNGVSITLQTMGRVSGSEFGMLITLTNLIASIALWLGLFGLWAIIPSRSDGNPTPTEDGEK